MLTENGVDPGSCHHKKYLKMLIIENIEGAEFVKSNRANESQPVVSQKLFGTAVTSLSSAYDDE